MAASPLEVFVTACCLILILMMFWGGGKNNSRRKKNRVGYRSQQPVQELSPESYALVQKAQNLELARDWENAALAYQQAGLYQEAGRIRQQHLEKSRQIVNIGQLGDTVLNDSVIVDERKQN